MEKNIIIVGAGIAGLSAGCYACMNGFKASIFEKHSIPGGLCTAWKRKGYTWDISMHLVTNSRKGPFHPMWEELGVTNVPFHYHQQHMRIESRDKTLTVGTDKDELQKAMLAISRADKKRISKFVNLIFGKSMMDMANLKPPELFRLSDTIEMFTKLLPHIGLMIRYSKSTIQDFAREFKDPFLQNAVRFFIDSPGWPMIRFPTVAMGGLLKSSMIDAGVPMGGSHRVIREITDRFEKLGGRINYDSPVNELIIEQNTIRGIRLNDGTEHHGDMVIWGGDGHHLIFDLLKGSYINEQIRKMYETWAPVLPLVQVMIGVNRDMSGEPHRILIELEKPLSIANEEHRWLCLIHHCFDPSAAPSGKSAVEVWFATDFNYWHNLSQDPQKYRDEKNRIAKLTIAELDKRWPGFASQVEVVDVPTPVTYARFTGNWRGSPDGWYVTPENMTNPGMLRTLPGLSGLYMIGQWTAPFTGTVMAALSGRQAIQMICSREGKEFKSC